ncbi:MAG: hypothetical protein OCU22_03655 [Canidatus Methanoxibalbensis ujae]|nr:hypothetical protein [Candidatus Methanoxibalbensis ujae]
MSTEFFWDKEKRRSIFTRYAGGLDPQIDSAKHLRYVFNNIENLVAFFTAEDSAIIYDEYDTPWTVASLRLKIVKDGVILIDIGEDGWRGRSGQNGK